MALCPECGKTHRNTFTARDCVQRVYSEYTHAVIANVAGKVGIGSKLRERHNKMKDFYETLPLPKRVLKV